MFILKNKLFLSLLSGILLWFSWYPYGFVFFIFVALVPLLKLSDQLLEKEKGLTLWQGIYTSFPAFLIWNVGVTWWIWNSTAPGAIAAIALNSFFMSFVFGMWHWVKKSNLPKIAISLAFIAFWCAWEFLHLNWQITWPWLNLGNVFATHPKLVQWYQYTGTFGGTIWVLTVNFLIYNIIIQHTSLRATTRNTEDTGIHRVFCETLRSLWLCAKKTIIILTLAVIIPILISFIIYKTYKINTEKGIEVVVVQQNIDAWTEQFYMTNYELAELIIKTATPNITSNTALIVCPESALPSTINEKQLYHLDIYPHPAFALFDDLFQEYPQMNLIMGLSTIAFYENKISSVARKFPDGSFAEFYNTSCLYNKDTIQLYHKSRLVPGVEKMPYPQIFGFLGKLAIDLGGTSGSLGSDTAQRVFNANTNQGMLKIGAPICYESIFGELFSKFVKKGAQVMCVITNDDWWGNTPGHQQHFEMSALRAIENRRYIMRAANTGISGIFDPLGKAHQKTEYKTRTTITQTVYLNNKMTFYTKYGDYLAKIMLGIAAIIVIIQIKKKYINKITNHLSL